ncbi:MAG: hypothetical protein M3Y26_09330 [Actinomycetota bacterium]|nr:hypothetical protein [Actinomycetota bacterium]
MKMTDHLDDDSRAELRRLFGADEATTHNAGRNEAPEPDQTDTGLSFLRGLFDTTTNHH